MKVVSLTLWMLVAFGLVTFLTLCDAQEETGGAATNAENPPNAEANAENPTETNEETPSAAEGESNQGNSTDAETPAESNPAPANNSTEPETTTQEPKVLKIDQMKTLMATKSSCKARFDVCMSAYLNTATDDGMCDNLKDQKDCLEEEKSGKKCSNDDYDLLKDIACHGLPRALVNGLLVCALPLLAWLLAHK